MSENKKYVKVGDKKYHLGAILTPPRAMQFRFSPSVQYDNSKLPVSVDLRSVLSSGGFKIFDQGNQGSCTANCGAADKAYDEILSGTYPGSAFSRAYLYWEERRLHGWENEDSGAEMQDIGTVLGKQGICLDSTMPYHDYDYTTAPSKAADAEALQWATDATQTRLKANEIKNFMVHVDGTLHPVRIGVPIPNSFLKSEIGGFVPMPPSGDSILGGHALLVVGYDDNMTHGGLTGYFIVLNSWGSLYGDKGYVYIPYKWMDYYSSQTDNWQQLDSTPGPGPGPTPPPKPNCINDFINCISNAKNPLTIFECIIQVFTCLVNSGATPKQINEELKKVRKLVAKKLQ